MNPKKKQNLISTISIVLIMLSTFPGAAAQTETSAKPAKKKVARRTPPVTAADVQALRDAVTAQGQQIQQLIQQMQSSDAALQQAQQQAQQAQQQLQSAQATATEAQQKASAAEATAAQQQGSVDKINSDLADVKTTLTNTAVSTQDEQKRTTALEALVTRFRFNGDVRIRGESYNQQYMEDRNRARIRVRFGFDGALNQDFIAGVALASGSLGDPSSSNETLTNVFDRKTIALDRAYITFNPVAHRWLSLTGGKFAFPWQRTSITFDPDLNPEGFDAKLSFDTHAGPLTNFTVQGIGLLYSEANSAASNASASSLASSQDSYAVGGQVSAKLQFGPWTATPSFLTLKWNRPDAILQASAFAAATTTTGATGTTPAGPFPVPGEGQGCAKGLSFPAFAPCVFAPNGLTNATYVDKTGKVHFYSGYNYADFILNNQIVTGLKKFPINLLLEVEDNLDAEAHPLDYKGNVLSQLGSQNKPYTGDFSLGQIKNKNDLQFGYAWSREEQDAVIASFVESDQRAPTNIIQNRVYALWKLRANTLASFTWWHGRVLNTYLENNAALFNTWGNASADAPQTTAGKTGPAATIKTAGQQEPYLNRFQFDLIYTF
jgi:hypothetical protein